MPSSAADRNLLFGILALQMDFITRDQLVAGMNAWVLEKHKPLGQILVEQKALREDLRSALDVMVDKHIEVHQHDAQASLASLSSISSVSQFLDHIFDGDIQASLARLTSLSPLGRGAGGEGLADAPTTAPPSADQSTAPFPTLSQAPGKRFRIIRPHARGGLGEVFVAEDTELNRQVALKEIQQRHGGDQDSRGRFVMEAEITGRLEHPGIVPVYSLGHYDDGRPFYAMRFIKGDSLKEAIERFHKNRQGDAEKGRHGDTEIAGSLSPGFRVSLSFSSLEFRQLLRRFLDVCNAVAYAHSRGVLHRDLKPGNIMLGEFGETLVVDWGLAKVVGRSEPEAQARADAEPTLRPASGSGIAETRAGAAMGTPQFMSPEQAAGRIAELGPASDVYSLGATLYVLLTGVPPIDRADLEVVLANVQMGEFPRPRERQAAVPPALEAVCLKAMALRPAARYSTPRALAEDIEHWLADEPVSAWPEPWTVKGRRWVGRHRTAVTGAAAALLVAVIASITANVLLSDAKATISKRELEARQAGVKALASATLASDRADEIEDRLATFTMQLARVRFEENHANLACEILVQVPEKHRNSTWNALANYFAGSVHTFRGHTNDVTGVTFSPDGQIVASASWDMTAKLWDARTGKESCTLRGHTGKVLALMFSPDNRIIATGGADKTIKLGSIARKG